MKIAAISDLHGNLPIIEQCDALLICGDISPLMIQRNDEAMTRWMQGAFNTWINKLPCDKVFLIAGNHDFWMDNHRLPEDWNNISSYVYGKLIVLNNESFNYNGITIYGTPECKWIGSAWAFMNDNEELQTKYANIPTDLDILMTHEAPALFGMSTSFESRWQPVFGSHALAEAILEKKPRYAFCGHVHSGEHTARTANNTTYVNVALLDEKYEIAYDVFYFTIDAKIEKAYINAAKSFIEEIQYDNGIIDRYKDVVYPKEWVDKIAKVAKVFFVANPDKFTEEDIETIACGCSDDNKFVYGELAGYNDLIDTLNEYFENI